VPAWLSKNGRAHRVYLTNLEVGLFREQLVARAASASLVFSTVTGQEWNKSGFGERVWRKSVAAAARHRTRRSPRSVLVTRTAAHCSCGTTPT
jgi:hypothetical protein